MKKKIKSKTDEFLEKAEITNIEPLHAGTGYCSRKISKEFPDLDPKEAWNLINQKFHEGIFPEERAVDEVIKELMKKRSK